MAFVFGGKVKGVGVYEKGQLGHLVRSGLSENMESTPIQGIALKCNIGKASKAARVRHGGTMASGKANKASGEKLIIDNLQ